MHAHTLNEACEDEWVESNLSQKKVHLEGIVAGLGRVVVAYSGGVDSSFLAATAHSVLGDDSLAVTAVSPSLARRELREAEGLARSHGWNHEIVGTHEVGREEYARNDGDRCYWCKSELFDVLSPIARERAAEILVGTNVDDLGDHRPGLRAADERDVRAPLVEAGLTKDEIRALAREMGLPTADKPASPCLSSRFAYGVRVTPEGLRRIDRAEEFIRSLGFEIFRVRDHGDLARVEVPSEEVEKAASLATEISAELKRLGYAHVSLDLSGFRSGSLNAVLAPPSFGAPRA
ncbi:MAG: pyridinium-3,5-biscarboxylic acid mononucleotide sulfurtransferase [Actinomycetota bacterium]|nr:pyridinium-3,5-biscarboxylic acid mononucleotide sulfurtransferase [Actinomycetota bacterium]